MDAPQAPLTISIKMRAVDHASALRMLEDICKEVEANGSVGTSVSASPSGSYSLIVEERNVETEQYQKEMVDWLERTNA